MSSDEIEQITEQLQKHAAALSTLIADVQWLKWGIMGIIGGIGVIIVGLTIQVLANHFH